MDCSLAVLVASCVKMALGWEDSTPQRVSLFHMSSKSRWELRMTPAISMTTTESCISEASAVPNNLIVLDRRIGEVGEFSMYPKACWLPRNTNSCEEKCSFYMQSALRKGRSCFCLSPSDVLFYAKPLRVNSCLVKERAVTRLSVKPEFYVWFALFSSSIIKILVLYYFKLDTKSY